MNVHGSHRFAAAPEAVFDAICDPGVLLSVIPGCEAVEEVAPGEYAGRISLRLPGATGTYRTRVRLVDPMPPRRSGLEGHVEGAMGAIDGRADFELNPRDGGTDLAYRGAATIQGPLARLDSRFAERLATSLIGQGLRTLELRLATEDPE